MLENNLSSLKSLISLLKILVPVVMFCTMGFVYWATNSSNIILYTILGIVGCIIGYVYFYLRYIAEKKSLENYLYCLQNKQFTEALNYGRMYYAIKRNGISGAGGAGLTIYDEQAINNDIAAYSK
ncbi:hypothetical protein [Pedobacter sp. ASV28]|uniref:hypothetical protein n=1 Tax=Pedobacter sp. ASV28 TaxID=2795123 RepID=UPI0018EE0CEB|nr:hypothetical protein [Pedobacter sp. ASV28]